MGWFGLGALVGVVGWPILAGLTALVFRFPVPFDAYLSGPTAVWPAMMGSVFYGVLGGFVAAGMLGGIGGVLGARRGQPVTSRMRWWCVAGALGAAEIPVLILSVLDWIVGPW